jgi:dTDP-glucose 4,6-dehydratase
VTVLVTGAAGFIGSHLVKHLRDAWPDRRVISLDALTYAGSRDNLAELDGDPHHTFVEGDVADRDLVAGLFSEHSITGVFHLAAESHVDRSIAEPLAFVQTNVVGTVVLLQEAQCVWGDRRDVRFLHCSTDEVFGALGETGEFRETTAYDPSSPYSASKAAADHFARAWHRTYGLPVVITNCTNNYGPYQFPEKLIPVVITRALGGEPVPVYGRGENVRDWLHVADHCRALRLVFESGAVGETYCIGGESPARNIDLVTTILDEIDRLRGAAPGTSRALISFVTDRPGHDFRYAMDITKIRRDLAWTPAIPLTDGLRDTVRWFLDNQPWCSRARARARDFEAAWYGR